MHVTTAFLYGETLQEIYVILPDEFRTTVEIEGIIRKLLKSFYVEHQTPHA